jgi:hypothetical protein
MSFFADKEHHYNMIINAVAVLYVMMAIISAVLFGFSLFVYLNTSSTV